MAKSDAIFTWVSLPVQPGQMAKARSFFLEFLDHRVVKTDEETDPEADRSKQLFVSEDSGMPWFRLEEAKEWISQPVPVLGLSYGVADVLQTFEDFKAWAAEQGVQFTFVLPEGQGSVTVEMFMVMPVRVEFWQNKLLS